MITYNAHKSYFYYLFPYSKYTSNSSHAIGHYKLILRSINIGEKS
jgi:hypothetical protein